MLPITPLTYYLKMEEAVRGVIVCATCIINMHISTFIMAFIKRYTPERQPYTLKHSRQITYSFVDRYFYNQWAPWLASLVYPDSTGLRHSMFASTPVLADGRSYCVGG